MSHVASFWAIRQRGISPSAKLVLMVLADYHNSADGGCFPSVGTLADVCCCDSRTIRRAIDELEKVGLIQKQTRKNADGRQRSNQYTLVLGEIGEGDNLTPSPLTNLSPLEPVITNQDSDTSYQTNSSLSFTDLLEEEPPDERKIFWDESIGSLMAMGLADPTARSWLGKCLKMAANDYSKVAEVIQAAVDVGTMDPISFMAAALGGKKAKKKREIDDAFAELRAASDKRKQQWAEDGRYDDTGGGGGDDHVVLQSDELSKPESVRKDGRKGVRKVSVGNAPQIVRPNLWNPDAREVSADNRGIGGGGAETF